ncbi:MAG TPA: hypothetical protein PL137_02790, partial [Nocardioides sp.]|nr:hypothetical protein [Nocardioides sp.]
GEVLGELLGEPAGVFEPEPESEPESEDEHAATPSRRTGTAAMATAARRVRVVVNMALIS